MSFSFCNYKSVNFLLMGGEVGANVTSGKETVLGKFDLYD